MIRCIEVSFWVLAFHLSSVTVLMQQNPQAFLGVLVTKTLECVFQGLHSVPSPSSFVWLPFAPSARGIYVDQRHSDLLRGYKEVGRQAVVPSALKSRGMSKAWTFSGPSQITVTLAELNRLENVNILKAPALNGTSVSPALRTVPGTGAQKWKNGWMDEHWAMENGRRRISGAIVLFWVVARGSQSADGEFTFGEDGPSPGPVSSMWT